MLDNKLDNIFCLIYNCAKFMGQHNVLDHHLVKTISKNYNNTERQVQVVILKNLCTLHEITQNYLNYI